MGMSGPSQGGGGMMAEINVTPFVDVMLVLLIIFMVTAPLLNLGVDVDLPKSRAHALEQKKDALVVEIESDGSYKFKIGDADEKTIAFGDLAAKVAAFQDQNPDLPVYIAAAGTLDYQKVMDLMTLLQGAGVSHVALMSKPAQAAAATSGNH